MSLDNVLKEVQAFIKESAQLTNDYRNHSEKLNKDVQTGMRGSVEASQELEQKKSQIGQLLQDKASVLQDKIIKVQEDEIKKIEGSEESITADTLAELNLLSQLELSHDEMDKYINKYRRTPLALKKLKGIAFEQGLMNQFPTDREEQLKIVLGRMSNRVSEFSRPNYDGYEITTNMKSEGATNSLAEDVSYYHSL